MKTVVCSLMWGTAWERYGKLFAETFDAFWPEHVELVVVSDKDLPLPRGKVFPMANLPAIGDFQTRYANDRPANGFVSHLGVKTNDLGYSFRHDAVKWVPQAIAPMAVLKDLVDGDIFVWLDADVETYLPVPEDWVVKLLDGAEAAVLQRPGTHSEIGFYAMRINDSTRFALSTFAEVYRNDYVFTLPEWHSAFVWDRCVAAAGLAVKNLNVNNGRGHVWPDSPLGAYTVHFKGKRKPQ